MFSEGNQITASLGAIIFNGFVYVPFPILSAVHFSLTSFIVYNRSIIYNILYYKIKTHNANPKKCMPNKNEGGIIFIYVLNLQKGPICKTSLHKPFYFFSN